VLFGRTDAGRDLFDKVRGATGVDDNPAPVQITEAVDYDPEGTGGEYHDRVGFVFDGDQATTWRTERYDQADIGNKSGVGIVVTIGSAADLDELQVVSPTANWSAQVYVSSEIPADLAGWGEPVATQEAIPAGTATFSLGGAHGSHVLLWITNVGAPNGIVEVAEVTVTA
jgi:hypothetical protein